MASTATAPPPFNRRTIIGNIAALLTGTTIAQGLTAITLLITARQLGPSGYGQYAGSLALCTFTSILFSLGLDMWFLREAGRHPTGLGELMGSALFIKTTLGCLWLVGMLILSNLLDSSTFPKDVLRLTALGVWFANLFSTMLESFKAALRNQITSTLLVATNLVWLAATLVLIVRGETLTASYIMARVLVLSISLAGTGLLIWRIYRPWPQKATVTRAMHQTLPFAVSEFLAMAYLRVDVMIIAFLLGETAVGLYSPAVSLVNSLFLIQGAIYGVMMPVLSNLFANHPRQAWRTAWQTIKFQAVLGLGMSVGLALGAKYLVVLLGPRFVGSVEIVQILSVIIFIHSISFAMAAIIDATYQQSKRALVQTIAVALNIVLNLLVVKWAGIRGAAVNYVITVIILMVGYTAIVLSYRARHMPRPLNKRIILLNAHTYCNAGDAALIQVAIEQLNEHFPDSQVTLIANDPDSFPDQQNTLGSFFTWITQGSKWKLGRLAWLLPASLTPVLAYRILGSPWFGLTPKSLRQFLAAYLESDLAVSIPGGFFYHSGKGLTLLVTAYTLALAILAGKPLYIFPQSIGPFKHGWELTVARWLYSRARVVMAREVVSLEQLEACQVPKERCILLPDMAFAFTGASAQTAQEWLKSKKIERWKNQPLLGITAIDWETQFHVFPQQANYEAALAAATRFFVGELGGKVVLLPQCWGPTPGEDDRRTARRIAGLVADLGEAVIAVDDPVPPDLLKAVFGQLDLLVGTRMHSNIFALVQGVPVIPIGYLHKTRGIAQAAGIEEWVIDIHEINDQKLIQKISELWANRERVRLHLEEVMPKLIQESHQAGEILAQDFASFSQGRENA